METLDDSIELCNLLSLLVRAMINGPEPVVVSAKLLPSGSTMLQVNLTNERDLGRLIGKQGRTAHSLRVIVQTIGRAQGRNYQLDIDGSTFGSTQTSQEV
jgi:uncharacterized protein